MCDYCIRSETIAEIEARHGVRWCDSCNRYYPIDSRRCSVCEVLGQVDEIASRAVNSSPVPEFVPSVGDGILA